MLELRNLRKPFESETHRNIVCLDIGLLTLAGGQRRAVRISMASAGMLKLFATSCWTSPAIMDCSPYTSTVPSSTTTWLCHVYETSKNHRQFRCNGRIGMLTRTHARCSSPARVNEAEQLAGQTMDRHKNSRALFSLGV